ncbi:MULTISPECIES: DUF1481 domain-containing protein [Vibrio]|uniref:DUF1481 domain-containing protein n=1 Tax=Vibrio TaxID=662 RepID=UPI00128E3F08|nr:MULTISPECIES: DUF1481 domain-containing protein [Vibrio]MPW37625.1 DUF1481 domain-containing protein [Vibrio sp. B1Z05]
MKHLITSALAILTLAGCSSATTPLRQASSLTEYSGGYADDSKTALYWLTQRVNSPETSSDSVTFKDKTWYKSHYVWGDNNLQEIIRTGERLTSTDKLVPYQMTLRFSGNGEAVYQRLRLNGKVIPMDKTQIDEVKQQANDLVSTSKVQQKQGVELIQGYWERGVFMTCEGRAFNNIELKEKLPTVVIDRLKDEENFAAFVGEYQSKKIVVDKLLILKHGNVDCIEKPNLES